MEHDLVHPRQGNHFLHKQNGPSAIKWKDKCKCHSIKACKFGREHVQSARKRYILQKPPSLANNSFWTLLFSGGGGNKSQYLVGWGLVTLQGTLPKCAIVNVLQAEENTCSEYIEQNTKSLIYTTVHIAVQASRRQFNLLNNSRSSKNAVINRTVVPWYLRSLLPYKECRENPDHCSVHSSQTTYPGSSLPVLAYRRMNFNWGSIHPNLETPKPMKNVGLNPCMGEIAPTVNTRETWLPMVVNLLSSAVMKKSNKQNL